MTAATLVVTGGDDPRSTPAMTRALAARLQHGRAVVIDGARHLLPIERADLVADLVSTFLLDPCPTLAERSCDG